MVRIRIHSVERPVSNELEEQLEFICKAFGVFENEERDKTALSVFREIVELNRQNHFASSQSLQEEIQKSRGAIINQLNKLIETGIIVREKRVYKLRASSLERTIEEMQIDIERVFENAKKIAKQIDEEFCQNP